MDKFECHFSINYSFFTKHIDIRLLPTCRIFIKKCLDESKSYQNFSFCIETKNELGSYREKIDMPANNQSKIRGIPRKVPSKGTKP